MAKRNTLTGLLERAIGAYATRINEIEQERERLARKRLTLMAEHRELYNQYRELMARMNDEGKGE